MPSSGYTAITFVANEQPTTAKWNLIGSNDASFNTGDGFNDNIIKTRHLGSTADLQIPLARLDHTTAYADLYNQSGITAPGEFADALRKTFDISSIPDGANFVVSAMVRGGDGTNGNVYCRILYNGVSYVGDSFGIYHLTGTAVAPLKKVSGQNSVSIYTGGSKNHNLQSLIAQSN